MDRRGMRIPPALAALLSVVILGGVFVWRAQQNYLQHDYLNSNFFSFWLSGHMVWTGQSPYDTSQFIAGFDAAGATYRPSKILQYPLPLMYFMAPIGALPLGTAYFVWQLVSLAIVALVVFLLLRREPHARRLFVPLTLFLMFFGPVYLSLQVGSVGAFALLGLALAIVLLRADHPLLAGLSLSLVLLKPPQALTILLLAGLWFLARRQWRVLAGLALGAVLLLIAWLVRDPLGLVKFRGSSDALLGRTLGAQSNVFSFAYLACGNNENCMWVVGGLATLLIVALGAFILYSNRSRWSDWEAFNIIIPLGFLSAVYLWSYDQLPYVIPVVWIAARLLRSTRSYPLVFAFLVVLDGVSLAALLVQAYTRQDLLSVLTTLLVLGMCAWLLHTSPRLHPSTPSPAV